MTAEPDWNMLGQALVAVLEQEQKTKPTEKAA